MMFCWTTAAVLVFGLACVVQGVAIDNDVVGDPTIECLDDKIRFSVPTRKVFAGRIYAKGKATDAECTKAGYLQYKTTSPMYDLSLGICGMKVLRSMEPRGMYYGITVVVSFHPFIITKVDKAFHVKCFFEEAERGLTAELGVSMIPTTESVATRTASGCTYSIHKSSLAQLDQGGGPGPAIQYAQIGEKILHRWECNDAMFGMLVKSCYVSDGLGLKADVIDSKGCPLDPILITGIRYSSNLTQAYAESHVFKFADLPGVWFYCNIQLCMKANRLCEGVTPPSCTSANAEYHTTTAASTLPFPTAYVPRTPENIPSDLTKKPQSVLKSQPDTELNGVVFEEGDRQGIMTMNENGHSAEFFPPTVAPVKNRFKTVSPGELHSGVESQNLAQTTRTDPLRGIILDPNDIRETEEIVRKTTTKDDPIDYNGVTRADVTFTVGNRRKSNLTTTSTGGVGRPMRKATASVNSEDLQSHRSQSHPEGLIVNHSQQAELSNQLSGQLIIYDLDEEPPSLQQYQRRTNGVEDERTFRPIRTESCLVSEMVFKVIIGGFSGVILLLSLIIFGLCRTRNKPPTAEGWRKTAFDTYNTWRRRRRH